MQNGSAHRSTDSVADWGTLPSIPTSINGASYHVGDAKSPQERLIASLISKIRNQLPHHSGRSIIDLETDPSLQHAIETLVDAGKERLDRVAWSLSELLQNVFKSTQESAGAASYLEHLTSLLYVLQVLCTAMARHWETYTQTKAAANAAAPGPKERVWKTVEPPPIDNSVATYILSVVLLILRQFHVKIRRPRVGGHTRIGTITDFEVYNLRGSREATSRSSHTLYPFTPFRFDAIFTPPGEAPPPHEQIPASAFDMIGSSFHLSNSPATFSWLIQSYAARVIFQLSCSNWPVVFAKIRQKIRQFASRTDDRSDVMDINLIQYSALTRVKLVGIMQELGSLLVNMREEGRSQTAQALRTALRNWARFSPREAHDIIANKLRFEGTTERLFDQFLALVKYNPENRPSLWPVLVPLLAVSPERLSQISMSSYRTGVKNTNFLASMVESLTYPPSGSTELATGCLMDFCKGAAVLSPDLQSAPLYTYSADLALDLLDYFVRSDATPDATFKNAAGRINVALCCDLLFVVYRFHPEQAMETFPLCLDPRRTDAVKLCAVDALITIFVESAKYPWFKSVDALFQFAPLIRANFTDAIRRYIDNEEAENLMDFTTNTVSDDWATDPTLSEREYLILSTLTLFRLDNRMLLHGSNGYGSIPEDLARLMRPANHRAIRLGMAKSGLSLVTGILSNQGVASGYVEASPANEMGPMKVYHTLKHLVDNDNVLPLSDPLDIHLLHATLGFSILTQTGPTPHTATAEIYEHNTIYAELAALVHLAYYRTASLHMACEILGMIARSEELGLSTTSRYLNPKESRERIELYKELYIYSQPSPDPEIQNTRMRAALRRISFPWIVYTAMWRDIHRQWRSLLNDVHVGRDTASSMERKAATWEDWRNVTLFLAATLPCCLEPKGPAPESEFPVEFLLPPRLRPQLVGREYEKGWQMKDIVDKFLDHLVGMLVSTQAFQRETALEAVCFELDPSFYPDLLFKLDASISATFNQSDPPAWEEPHKTFAVQYTLVLKSIFDRMDVDVGPSVLSSSVDLARMLQCLVRYLDRSSNNVLAFRIKTKFVYMIESFLSRSKWLPPRKENFLRNVLLIFISGWTSDSIPHQAIHAQQNHEIIHELDIACLRCIAELTSNVRLQPVDNITSALDTIHVQARLFHRQLGFFMAVIERWLRNRHLRRGEVDVLKLLSPMAPEDETKLWDYSVKGIVNLLENNTHAGLAEALSFCYHEEPDIRSIFLAMFAKALDRAVDLSSADVDAVGKRHSYICESLKAPDLMLALSVLENCPTKEVDEKCQMLLNIFNTRRTLVPLLKAAIDFEVENTQTSGLFRSNDMRNLLLTAFCKKYGLEYLQTILSQLIAVMASQPDQSYEIDAARATPGSNTAENIELVKRITKAFLDVILESVDAIPYTIREVCAHLAYKVKTTKMGGKAESDAAQAVGAFMFLRFICPAIVTPAKVDVVLPANARNIQKGLLLVTKIIQSLANNARFRERSMAPFNSFLEENIYGVTRFIQALQEPPNEDVDDDEPITVPYEEADHMMAHQFFSYHADAVGRELFRFKGIFSTRRTLDSISKAKTAWDDICSILVDLGPVAKYPSLTKISGVEHPRYGEFVIRNAARDTRGVEHLFYEVVEERTESTSTFIFHINQVDVELVEPSVVSIHILQLLSLNTSKYCKVILDCSKFSSTSDLPVPWITEFFDVIPFDLLSQLTSVEILNPNRLAQGFLRKAKHLFMGFSSLNIEIDAMLSQSEKFEELHPGLTLPGENLFDFGPGTQTTFEEVYIFDELGRSALTTLTFEELHLRVTMDGNEPLFGDVKCRLTEYLDYEHIQDVGKSAENETHFIVKRGDDRVIFESDDCEEIMKAIRVAKARFQLTAPTKFPRPRVLVGDHVAILLNIGLVNVCHPIASVRNSALGLVCALTTRVGYSDPLLLELRNGFLPAHPNAFAGQLSEKLGKFAPELTFDYISEFERGYQASSIVIRGEITRKYASKQAPEEDFRDAAPGQELPIEHRREAKREEWLRWHRTTELLLIGPWIRNLELFADPSHRLWLDSDESLRSAVRSLINITVQDVELSRVIMQYVWTEVAKLDSKLVSGLVTDELIKAAAHAGSGSVACDAIADIFTLLPSLAVRAKLLAHTRRTLGFVTGYESDDATWNDIGAAGKLLAASLYNTRAPVHTLTLAPEICHTIAMLALVGNVSVRGAVAGMLVNFIQSLLAARIEDAEAAAGLKALLTRCSGPETLRSFGLIRIAPNGNEYRILETVSEIEAVENICTILLELIPLGATSSGFANTWRSRWMSLTTWDAFQTVPFTQARALLILGAVCPVAVDDDYFYQMVYTLKNAMERVQANDERVAVNLLRCVHKMTPGLVRSTRSAPLIIWGAASFLHAGMVSIFSEAAHLLRVMLESLYGLPQFQRRTLFDIFAQTREPLEAQLRQIDTAIGLSFDPSNFSLAMANSLFRGMRCDETVDAAEKLLRTLLVLSARQGVDYGDDRKRPVSPHSIGFFLALLPTVTNIANLDELVRGAGGEAGWASSANGDPARPRLPFAALGITDDSRALLVVTFLIGILDTAERESEQELLFALLAEASQAYPDVVALTSDAMLEVVTSAFNEASNRDIMTHAAVISSFATRNDIQYNNNNNGSGNGGTTPNQRSSTISETISVSRRSTFASREHLRQLEDLGMTGMLSHHQFLPQETATQVIAWLPTVIDGMRDLFYTARVRR